MAKQRNWEKIKAEFSMNSGYGKIVAKANRSLWGGLCENRKR